MELSNTQLVNLHVLVNQRATIVMTDVFLICIFVGMLMMVMRATTVSGTVTQGTCSLNSQHNQSLRMRTVTMKYTNTNECRYTVCEQ